ncbi:5'-AMP-activated protein kinase-related [Quillaja saponaria]|uniref:5'-AMP-activated protein kinase-related n=1 Tax=Quillaja saponaria TaxID=32244 RepID=A0AAD7PG18_QUISA|nr:5'-AMP-activated protein kinase-related [Quillaja saponaria]
MLCHTASSSCFLFTYSSVADLICQPFSSVTFIVGSRRQKKRLHSMSLNLVAAKETGALLGYADIFKKGSYYKGLYWGGCSGFVRRCKNWDSEGDFSLEAEILEFMKNSKNPEAFPSKKDLVDAGRIDLVDAIVKKGGWLSFGWDLDEEDEEGYIDVRDWSSFVSREYDRVKEESNETETKENRGSGVVSSFSATHSQSATSSNRSLETEAEDESGIEGILNRLERHRNVTLGLGLGKTGNNIPFPSNGEEDEWHYRISTNVTVASLKRSSRPSSLSSKSGIFGDVRSRLSQNASISDDDGSKKSLKPETWRTWSIQRAGFSYSDFEAAEIAPSETRNEEGGRDVSKNEMLEMEEVTSEHINKEKSDSFEDVLKYNKVQNRIQQLESELSSALLSLRSMPDEVASEGHESSSTDLQTISDAWEFQENEIMNAQGRLRSIRAKLAVLEGKMALAVIEAQKMMKEKQKRLDDTRITQQLLRTACIVWPNSASEVLLSGSFDGWATQRKMEKSSTGIFSLCLKLYPGKYEIKFIVEGEWRIDPLRPIVRNNGYENNLLIIT